MNYIHFTRQFEEEIKDESKKDFIYSKLFNLENVEKLETLNSVDKLYKEIYIVKFSKTNLCRIITQLKEVQIDNEQLSVLFIREFITKKGFDYYWGSVLHPQLKSGEWLRNNELPQEEIDLFKKNYLEKSQNVSILEKVPTNLTGWLNTFKTKIRFDVFEREDWVLFGNNQSIENGLRERDIDKFKKLIKDVLNPLGKTKFNREHLRGNVYKIVNEDDEIGIIISDFENVEGNRLILLHSGANIRRQKNHWEQALVKAKKIINDVEPNLEKISKDAFRAYPEWILKSDDEYWSAIQKHDETHNLSLLPEQIEFLNNFKFPSYINGQAGSGKSTMLYYLFANVFAYKNSGELNGDILFLTENDNLLEHTIRAVIGLLANNPEFDFGFSVEEKTAVRKYFSSFKQFLINILPEEERSIFLEDKYLDFPRFKEKFNKQYSQTKKIYSAEEVWFVISTYVYGYFEDIKVDNLIRYNEIPSKFRVIEDSRFFDIINSSLSFYDKLIEDGWWDKTTLVRSIRKFFPKKLPKQYTVVFCDEAQDFSRIEIRLILDSSVYMNYDLSNSEQIPVVFAGDALQTVSPIGFSVRRLQQMYYDVFKQVRFEYDKKRSTYTPNYNYRSLEPIVKLANVVQNYRKVSLKEDFTLKQKTKRTRDILQPPIIHYKEWLSKDINKEIFKKKFKYKSFIIPVDLNEEEGYIDNDELLNNTFPDIKSSIDAKGAEYNQVVVYGFGDDYLKNFGTIDWNVDEYDFKKKFFFNKLYVAITRAQNELVIIDSTNGVNKFWKPLIEIPDNKERWEDYEDINEIVLINPETGLEKVAESIPEDAYKNANLDMEQGIRDKNSARLIVASNIFMVLGENNKANICLGHKELIKRNWSKAADYFMKAKEYELASNALFHGKLWMRLSSDIKHLEGNRQEIRLLVAKIMMEENWTKQDLSRMYELRDILNRVIHNVIWYDEFSEKIKIYSKKINSNEEKRDLVIILENLVKDEDWSLQETIANLYFDSKQYSQAIQTWDKIYFNQSNFSYSLKYIRAQVGNASDEDNLQDELLWSGRLLELYFDVLDTGEIKKLSKKIYKTYKEEPAFFEKSEVEYELYSHLYSVLVYLNEITLLSEVGRTVEKQVNHEVVINLYTNLIQRCKNEEISIFLKERWIKIELKGLLKKGEKGIQSVLEIANERFIKKEFPFSSSNQKWTIKEINEISELPQMVSSIPSKHLKNIIIQNFRKFENLEVNNIGQFNLILGDNNSGKTSLLEAFLFSHNPDECLLNFLFANQQRNNNAKKENIKLFFDNIIFKNHKEENKIKFTIKDGRRFWRYDLMFEYSIEEEDNLSKYNLVIESSSGKKELSKNAEVIFNKLDSPDIMKDIPFIAFGKGYSEKLASIYLSEIGSVRSLRKNFINQLKIFIPNIVGILPNTDLEIIEIEEEIEGVDVTNYLHNYGEGANKLFRILVQLHSAKDKRLNIDEIDAGIHYSKFKQFWKIILKTASDYNVQLFATTHNEECIKYFGEVLKEEKEFESYRPKSRIITLEKHIKTKRIIPIVRNFENMQYAYEHHLEIRGNI